MNAELIRQNIPQKQRLEILNNTAINQLKSLLANNAIKKLTVKNNIPFIENKNEDE